MNMLSQAFREKLSKIKNYAMKAETEHEVGYSTGFLSFDFTNGVIITGFDPNTKSKVEYYSVGIPSGSMVTIIGRSAGGKTTLCVQVAANIVRPFENGTIVHEDCEGGISYDRKLTLTGFTPEELQKKYIHRNTGITSENFYERVKLISDIKLENREKYLYDTGMYDEFGERIYKLEPTVVILDSLAMLMPEKLTEEDQLSGQMSATASARVIAAVFKRMVPLLKSSNIILMVINHITQKIDINPMAKSKAQLSYLKQGESLPAGVTPIYLTSLMIRVDDHAKLKEEEGLGIAGSLVDITFVKSRTTRVGQTVTLVFDHSKGFDPELSLLVLLKDHKALNGAGAYLYIGNRDDKKFAQKNFKEKLHTDPEFAEAAMEVIFGVLRTLIQKHPHLEEQDENLPAPHSFATNLLNKFTK